MEVKMSDTVLLLQLPILSYQYNTTNINTVIQFGTQKSY